MESQRSGISSNRPAIAAKVNREFRLPFLARSQLDHGLDHRQFFPGRPAPPGRALRKTRRIGAASFHAAPGIPHGFSARIMGSGCKHGPKHSRSKCDIRSPQSLETQHLLNDFGSLCRVVDSALRTSRRAADSRPHQQVRQPALRATRVLRSSEGEGVHH